MLTFEQKDLKMRLKLGLGLGMEGKTILLLKKIYSQPGGPLSGKIGGLKMGDSLLKSWYTVGKSSSIKVASCSQLNSQCYSKLE